MFPCCHTPRMPLYSTEQDTDAHSARLYPLSLSQSTTALFRRRRAHASSRPRRIVRHVLPSSGPLFPLFTPPSPAESAHTDLSWPSAIRASRPVEPILPDADRDDLVLVVYACGSWATRVRLVCDSVFCQLLRCCIVGDKDLSARLVQPGSSAVHSCEGSTSVRYRLLLSLDHHASSSCAGTSTLR